MCGIAGVVSFDRGRGPDTELVRRMTDTLVHRGPDDGVVEVVDGVGLGMRRLSIIDVAGGRQPLVNETGDVRVVFNGEIYNFRELRRWLEARGHRFTSSTDGEVLPHLWEERGLDFVSELNGMFAIALHDVARGQVVLVRDRLGIKPLYWSATSDAVVFGSEIKALFASGLVPRRLDVDALGQLLAWEYVPEPQTLLLDVRKLEAGGLLVVDLARRRSETRSWWDVPLESADDAGREARSDREWEDEVDAKLRECVARQLVSDVPLGAFLSGGVDSSLVVAGMGAARTFSIGFEDQTYDESGWAESVARHLGVSHRTDVLEPSIGDLFERLMPFLDDPIGDFSIFPTYLVSKVAREEVTVALSGDGGDELFGGYETYVAEGRARAWSRLPSLLRQRAIEPAVSRLRPRSAKKGLVNKAKRFVEGLSHDPALGHARFRLFAGEERLDELLTPDARGKMEGPVGRHVTRLARRAAARSSLDRALYVDVKSYLVDNCLVKTDRMSMACSLEARVPFLDHELVELAFRVPSHLKVANGRTKVLLKRVAARHVPRACVYRPKQGFSIPIKNWLFAELRPLTDDLLDPGRLAVEGLFRPESVLRMKAEHAEGRANHSHVLWTLMVFQDWRRRWKV